MAKKAASPTVDQRGKEIIKAIQSFEEAKGLSVEIIVEALKESLVNAYQRETDKDAIARADVNLATGDITLTNIKTVVLEVEDDLLEISIEEAKLTNPDAKIGDEYLIPIDIFNFTRASAMHVRTVLKQKIREAEKESIYNEYITKKDEIITGIVEKVNERFILINLGRVISIMPLNNMIPGERYHIGDTIRVYVVDVTKDSKGSSPVVVSRNDPNFLKRIFEQEISEIYDGTVEIKAIAREAGDRSKIAVYSRKPNVDPTGACIGPKGVRIQSISQQLLGEKIDVIQYNEIPELYVAESLKPAIIYGLAVNHEEHSMVAIVANEDFSHAIGKRGQNARLAVKLTGWKIDIKTVDDALSLGIVFKTMNEINRYYEQLAHDQELAKLVNKITAEENVLAGVEGGKIVAEPVVEEVKTEVKIEEKVEETPIKITSSIYEASIPYSATSTLEERTSIEEKAAKIQEIAKKTVKKAEPKTEKTEVKEKTEAKKETTDPNKNYLSVYSQEELEQIEAEIEEENKADEYEEDVDYEDYDEYYE